MPTNFCTHHNIVITPTKMVYNRAKRRVEVEFGIHDRYYCVDCNATLLAIDVPEDAYKCVGIPTDFNKGGPR